MVDEEKLHHRLLVRDGLWTIGIDHHALCGRLLAGRHELWERLELAGLGVGLPDLAEANAAVRHHREPGVVAVVRDLDVCIEGGLEDGLARLEGVLLAVDRELCHRSGNVAEGPARGDAWMRATTGRAPPPSSVQLSRRMHPQEASRSGS